MKRKELNYDSDEMDIEELQKMVDEMDSLINDAETRVGEIKDLLDIKSLDDLTNIEEAYEKAKELCDDLY